MVPDDCLSCHLVQMGASSFTQLSEFGAGWGRLMSPCSPPICHPTGPSHPSCPQSRELKLLRRVRVEASLRKWVEAERLRIGDRMPRGIFSRWGCWPEAGPAGRGGPKSPVLPIFLTGPPGPSLPRGPERASGIRSHPGSHWPWCSRWMLLWNALRRQLLKCLECLHPRCFMQIRCQVSGEDFRTSGKGLCRGF